MAAIISYLFFFIISNLLVLVSLERKSDDKSHPDYVPSIFFFKTSPEKRRGLQDVERWDRRKVSVATCTATSTKLRKKEHLTDNHLPTPINNTNSTTSIDILLADRGFTIEDSVNMYCAELVIPAFTKGKSQLARFDVAKTRKIAHVRVHVERVIGLLRRKYRILQSILPTKFVMSGKNGSTLDDIYLLIQEVYIASVKNDLAFDKYFF